MNILEAFFDEKGHKFVPIAKTTDECTTKQDVKKFLLRIQLKASFHEKEEQSDATEKGAFCLCIQPLYLQGYQEHTVPRYVSVSTH